MRQSDLEGKAVALLTDVDSLSKLYSLGLRGVHFQRLETKEAFEFAVDYWRQSGFRTAPTAEAIESKVKSIIVGEPDESAAYVAQEMKRAYTSRLASSAILDATDTMKDDPVGTVQRLSDTLWGIKRRTRERRNQSNMIDSIDDRRRRYAERAKAAEDGVIGESLGFDEVDDLTGGIRPGELVTLVAGPKVGKTWMMLQVARKCIERGHTCIVFTLEMDVPQIEDRFDAVLSGVSYARLDGGKLSTKEMRTLMDTQERESELGSIRFIKLEIGERTVENMVRIAKDERADLVIIDQLSFIETAKQYVSRADQVSNIILELKASISQDEDDMIPVLLLAQFNRAGASAGDKADISSIGLSSEVERTSDALISLSQTDEERANNVLKMIILASRRYDLGRFLIHRELVDRTDISMVRRLDGDE